MDINELLKKYHFEALDKFQEEDDDGGAETIETKEICTNENGLTLLEITSDVIDSMVSFETVCELFPDYDNLDPYKGYILSYKGTLLTE